MKMGKYTIAFFLFIFLVTNSYGVNFEGFGVGPGDKITFRVTDNHVYRWVDGSLTENYTQNFVYRNFGVVLTGAEWTVTLKNTSDDFFGPHLIGDYEFENKTIEDDYVREVNSLDWDTSKKDFTAVGDQVENDSRYFDIQFITIESDHAISFYSNFSMFDTIFQENITETNVNENRYDIETGILLYSFQGFYFHYTNSDGEYHFEEQIFSYGMVEYIQYTETKSDGFRIASPGIMAVSGVLIAIVTLSRRYLRNSSQRINS